ncbi:hypothetical protein QFZ97_004022 [Paraburkholderia youngii]
MCRVQVSDDSEKPGAWVMVVNSPVRIKVRRRKIVKLWGAIAKVWRQTIELIVAALSYAAIMKLSQWYRARQ